MANILDYIDWRGDVPMTVSPYNEIDNLIFAELSFVDLAGILPERVAGGTMPLKEAARRFFDARPDGVESLGVMVPMDIITMFRKMADAPRYRDLLLGGYVNHIDLQSQMQFAALTVIIDDWKLYVSFRGTDDTIVAWKENLNMSLLETVPAQAEAAAYLNAVAEDTTQPEIYVGGHSKGGNLAIFAAINADPTVIPRICRVYSNDGPGYRRDLVDSPAYAALIDRIETIVPETSVVGRLLEHDNRYTVVQSSASGLLQHDGFSWQVLGTHFVPAEHLSHQSEMIDRSLKKWQSDMDDAQREKFITALYAVLTSTNAQTLSELTADKNWLWKVLRASDSNDKKTVISALAQLTGETGRLWAEEILPFLRNRKKDDSAKEIVPTPKSGAKKAVPAPDANKPKSK